MGIGQDSYQSWVIGIGVDFRDHSGQQIEIRVNPTSARGGLQANDYICLIRSSIMASIKDFLTLHFQVYLSWAIYSPNASPAVEKHQA